MSSAVEGLLLLMCSWFSYTDIKERNISNHWTYAGLSILVIYRLFDPAFFLGLIPAAVLLLCWFFIPRSISKGELSGDQHCSLREYNPPFGEGDIKLFGVIGLALGLERTFAVFFWTCLFAVIFVKSYWIVKRRKLISLPLAPFILLALIFTMILKYAL
ncbi:prepilin peptidase [Paenibacillus polymyxa]|uniref:prepilin peptidase n=1 Tax=Paenibacillus polymyxa TaxID=1406 RepID=UPI001119D649|nr:A24 family peptidase [Paenibacillus polymyxa]QDA30202.1 prepilin peptidase [Paenibacillus polymyxa]